MTVASLPSNRIEVASLPKTGRTTKLSADEKTLIALAELTVLDSLEKCTATITAKPWKMNGAILSGEIHVVANQSCASTLEPIRSSLNLKFNRKYLPDADPVFSRDTFIDGELIVDPEADDLPDTLENGAIDTWLLVLEELNLQIDPYPRLEEFEWEESEANAEEDETHKPFADLKALITKKNSH